MRLSESLFRLELKAFSIFAFFSFISLSETSPAVAADNCDVYQDCLHQSGLDVDSPSALKFCNRPNYHPAGCIKPGQPGAAATPPPATPSPVAASPKNPDTAQADTGSTDAADAFAKQKAEADVAARESERQRAIVEQTMIATEEVKRQSLEAAQQALRDRAQAALRASQQAASRQPTLASAPTPDEAAVIHDAPIVNRAISQYEKDRPISTQDAAKAYIPEVRENLETVAQAQKLNERLEKRDNHLSEQIAGLMNLSTLALQRGQSMDSASKNDNPLLHSGAGSLAERTPSSIAIASSKFDQGTHGKTPGENDAHEGAENKNADKVALLLKQMKGLKDSPLRDRLRKRLAESRTAKAAEDGKSAAPLGPPESTDPFSGKLSSNVTSSSSADQAKDNSNSLAAQAVDSALRSSADRFDLAGPETDAAVRKILGDGSEEAALNSDMSIQGMNSLSMFERVRVAHNRCLKQHCVQTN